MHTNLAYTSRPHKSIEDQADICEADFFDAKKIRALQKRMKTVEELHELAEVFKVLSDPTRLKIVLALTEYELCVCDLANYLNVTKSAVSHQLRLLRTMRLVKFRRDGKMTYYSLDDHHITSLLKQATEHIEERR
ncbi:metalloregulator ArsR/SmtB family transcription factor [bacterium]|nr:metalloregulator ArsR/SmtB family transcription factor [bacterium]